MLSVRDLRKDFSIIRAVDGVSFDVMRGQIFGLLGRNGAGKTTTIRMVLNILEPDSGTITYDGRPFSPNTRNTIGYLPEERGLYRKSKIIDTILYFACLRGMDATLARNKAQEWLQRFELGPFAYQRVEELSKGNQQKVQFISAIIHDPALVILDEPFSGLDPVNQILFKDILLELKHKNKAIIYSTHQMDQAERLSDAICLIHHGRVVLNGPVREVKRTYGRNSLHLEFDGDGRFLPTLPAVQDAILYEHAAELRLADGASPKDVLVAVIDRLDLRKFELVEPSLQSIFVNAVAETEPAP